MSGNDLIISMPKRIRNIPLNAILAANTNVTLIAGKISFRYRIVEVEIVFRDDAANLLLIYVLASKNSNAPTTNVPPDYNIFSEFSPTPYIIGEGIIKNLSCNYEAEDGEYYIKVYASNQNAYAQTVNVTVKIEEI